jgi:hypothetical protein
LTGETVTIKKDVVSFSKDVYVELSTNLITIKGRIVDQRGNPIANAKISADIEIADNSACGEGPPSPQYFTCSDSQGDFELVGLPTTGVYDLAVYLGGAYETALTKLKITVQSPGFATKELFVYMVTDTEEKDALIFLDALNKMVAKNGGEKLELRTDKMPFPKSTGNTMYVDQIVLDGYP